MLYLGTTPLAGMIKTKLFTTSGTFVVPADVQVIWVDCCSGGSGGGGGDPTPGGGGGGGCCAIVAQEIMLAVVPAETLTIAVGAAGTGGAAGANGGDGGATSIVGSSTIYMINLNDTTVGGKKGANPNGGNSGNTGWYISAAVGGSGAGGNGVTTLFTPVSASAGAVVFSNWITKHRYGVPSAGGALNNAGGSSGGAIGLMTGQVSSLSGGSGNASGGGGGRGGSGLFGAGGAGGSNGAAGANAVGYGAGGGGGSGNSAGGNGSPGFVRIYYISKYTVA